MEQKYGKIFVISMIVTVVLLVISLITLGIALAIRGSDDRDDGKDKPSGDVTPSDEEGEDEEDAPVGGTPGEGVATETSRNDYVVKDDPEYKTVNGINSQYVILVELDSYRAIAGLNADKRICPASMTKVMTLLVACENLGSVKDQVTMSETAVAYRNEHEGSGLDWKGGEKVTVEDLLYLVFSRSDTVASITLAEYIAGSESAFVDMMNDKVDELGLSNTHFSNSTGLYFSGDEYYSTCRDMAAIMAYALDNPLAKKVMTTTGDWYLPKSAPVDSIRPTWLTDRFGGKATLNTVTIKGAKTGWEDIPGACLVSYAVSNGGGDEYIMVIVGGNTLSAKLSTQDVKAIYNDFAK